MMQLTWDPELARIGSILLLISGFFVFKLPASAVFLPSFFRENKNKIFHFQHKDGQINANLVMTQNVEFLDSQLDKMYMNNLRSMMMLLISKELLTDGTTKFLPLIIPMPMTTSKFCFRFQFHNFFVQNEFFWQANLFFLSFNQS